MNDIAAPVTPETTNGLDRAIAHQTEYRKEEATALHEVWFKNAIINSTEAKSRDKNGIAMKTGAVAESLPSSADALFKRKARTIIYKALADARISIVDMNGDWVLKGFYHSSDINVRVEDWRDWVMVRSKDGPEKKVKLKGNFASFKFFSTFSATISETGISAGVAIKDPQRQLSVSFNDPEWPAKLREGLRRVVGASPAFGPD